MSKQRSPELPQEIINRLREIVKFTGNEKAVDEDPVKVLLMLLYGLEEELSTKSGDIRYVVREYCSAFGMSIHLPSMQEARIAQ